jgi:uncharacterized DUF497 family protein
VHTIELQGDAEWDRRKSAANLLKHGVRFSEAMTALSDDLAVTVEDEDSDERRFVTVGASAGGEVLVVVYTWREERVRLISARRATPKERRIYGRTR